MDVLCLGLNKVDLKCITTKTVFNRVGDLSNVKHAQQSLFYIGVALLQSINQSIYFNLHYYTL